MGGRGYWHQRLADTVGGYLNASLAEFYAQGVNRLMLYCLLACFFLVAALLAWVILAGPGYMFRRMAFTTVYALHTALTYTLCHYLADAGANRMLPSWGDYEHRTVGRQWVVWSAGLVLGFYLHRTMLLNLVPYYAPETAAKAMKYPDLFPTHLTFALLVPPIWLAIVFLAIRAALARQQAGERTAGAARESLLRPIQSLPQPDNGAGTLKVTADAGQMDIPLTAITHITVEDHYSRIHYLQGDSGRLRNVLIRMPLKALERQLPPSDFVQIHRSHLVNLKHVTSLTRDGRQSRVALDVAGLELPVSRHRLPHIRPLLDLPGRQPAS